MIAAVWVLGLALPAADDDATPVSVEYLSETMVPAGLKFQGTCIGGLSALAYDASGDRYFALADARSDARFYTLDIDIEADAGGRPVLAAVRFTSVVRLETREGEPYADGRVDPEGFVLAGDGAAFISSEGVADRGVPPFVDRVDIAGGAFLQALAIPAAYKPWREGQVQVRGVRNNLGFEALALTTDGSLFVASESALAQDVGDVEAGTALFARLLHFRTAASPRLEAEFLYPLVHPPGDVVVHGLVELQALGAGRLLAMERTYAHDTGIAVKLFVVRLGETEETVDRAQLSPAARELPVLRKRALLDFGELPVILDNFEGLTLGPELPGGGESLLVLGDNDNTECQPGLSLATLRPTRLLLFRLRR